MSPGAERLLKCGAPVGRGSELCQRHEQPAPRAPETLASPCPASGTQTSEGHKLPVALSPPGAPSARGTQGALAPRAVLPGGCPRALTSSAGRGTPAPCACRRAGGGCGERGMERKEEEEGRQRRASERWAPRAAAEGRRP